MTNCDVCHELVKTVSALNERMVEFERDLTELRDELEKRK